MNRSILDKARCMFLGSNLGKFFWLEAALTAVYLINRSPNSALPEGKLPAELWYCRKPDLTKFRVFGHSIYTQNLKKVIVASTVKFDETKTKYEERYWAHEWQETGQAKSSEESREDTDSLGGQESFRGFEELPVDEEYRGCRVKKTPEYLKYYVVSGLKKGSRGKVAKEEDSLTVVLMGKGVDLLNTEQPENLKVFVNMSSVDDVNLAMSATGDCEGVPMNVEELNDRTDKNNWFKAIDEEGNSLVES
ncbi:hypothetical protein PR048_025219 [Dryococelus australis]|uniref:Uncharacterized protein n=1 Tax=Dryococelus australis TaxID=614101 RepID=A0ABQ9GQV4_9NEOP|nr:hypothetical protein PR048_025219 [Dryococelus australis]